MFPRYVTSIKNPKWIAIEISEGSYSDRICNDYAKSSFHSHDTRPSTPEEIAHLDACIAAGKLIPYSPEMLIPNPEIY